MKPMPRRSTTARLVSVLGDPSTEETDHAHLHNAKPLKSAAESGAESPRLPRSLLIDAFRPPAHCGGCYFGQGGIWPEGEDGEGDFSDR